METRAKVSPVRVSFLVTVPTLSNLRPHGPPVGCEASAAVRRGARSASPWLPVIDPPGSSHGTAISVPPPLRHREDAGVASGPGTCAFGGCPDEM